MHRRKKNNGFGLKFQPTVMRRTSFLELCNVPMCITQYLEGKVLDMYNMFDSFNVCDLPIISRD